MPPIYCPYKALTAPPCWNCSHYMPDVDQCRLASVMTQSVTTQKTSSISSSARSYEEWLKAYEKKREELLKLSKELLVDLILKRPTY